MKIVDKLHCLCNLTRLEVETCSFPKSQVDMRIIVNNIWSLPKLTYCHFSICIDEQNTFTLPTKLSISLKTVYISRQNLTCNQIYRLFEYTPRLKRLRIRIDPRNDDDYEPALLPTLIDLSISSFRMSDTSKILSLFRNTPNLLRLRVFSQYNLINGDQWEQVIRKYLPKLKVFKLDMKDELAYDQIIEERADELLNSFRSSFWIDEHQWFFRYIIYHKTIYIENSNNTFRYYSAQLPHSWKSTYPRDNHLDLYNNMTIIYDATFFDQSFSSDIRLPNIDYLCLKLPVPEKFWSIVPSLNALHSLTISLNNDTYQSQFQDLLNRSPHLGCLYISQDASLPLQTSLFKYTNASVRGLYLENYNHQFNEEECSILSHSPLGVQCDLLSIHVKNRESIIILVKNMIHLQALHVKCEDDEYFKHGSLTGYVTESHGTNISNKDDLIQWLKDQLPSTCVIARDPKSVSHIRMWI
jgi:hypothetical protein